MPRILLWSIPTWIAQVICFSLFGLISGCGGQQQSLVLDDYRLRLTAGTAQTSSTAVEDINEGQWIDCLVGHVAGRPLYAHDILDPMRDELSAVAAQSDPATFRQEARQRVQQRLEGEILNRLLIEEAALQRDPEKTAQFNDQVQMVAELLSRNSGMTDAAFRRKIQEENGVTPAQLAKDLLIQEEVRTYQRSQSASAGDVTWKDIERLYARQVENFDEGSFTLARFELENEDGIEPLRQALAAWKPGGDPAVLESLGSSYATPRSGGLWLSYDFEDGGIEEVTFGVPELQSAVRSLSVENPVTPIVSVNGRPWIVVLRTVDRSAPADLWDPDVQDQLRNALLLEQQRRALEANRRALVNNGDLSPSPNVMLRRLLEVVNNRHSPASGDKGEQGES
ncbi:MAG: hypothetical protein CMJ30_05455 [Phycisphaerae bacterium]|nr:hypothetical protein [Phycisphaerae bacterium]